MKGILDCLGDNSLFGRKDCFMSILTLVVHGSALAFTSRPLKLISKTEFINVINDFFNNPNTLRYVNTISIRTKEYTMSDGGKCYFIWVQGLLHEYNFFRECRECFTMDSLFFVNKVKDENGIMRWRIVDKLEEKGLPSPDLAFEQACDNGDFYCLFNGHAFNGIFDSSYYGY